MTASTDRRPRDSQIMAARLKAKLERELGREPDEWTLSLAAKPLASDRTQKQRVTETSRDVAERSAELNRRLASTDRK